MSSPPQPVLLYDGECGLCNAVVRFMLRRDRRGVLKFAPLQGAAGQAFLRSRGMNTGDFDSLVFVDDLGRADSAYHLRMAGLVRALHEMGGGWRRCGRVFAWVPAPVRDLGYKLVARVRYRVFGAYRPPLAPEARWAERFLE